MTKNNKDLSTEVQETLPAELKDTFNLKANMEGVRPRLPMIGIVHQAQLYVMPDESQIKEFEAIILDTNRINAWWEKSFDETGGGTPPDCFSMNGIECDQNCAMKNKRPHNRSNLCPEIRPNTNPGKSLTI